VSYERGIQLARTAPIAAILVVELEQRECSGFGRLGQKRLAAPCMGKHHRPPHTAAALQRLREGRSSRRGGRRRAAIWSEEPTLVLTSSLVLRLLMAAAHLPLRGRECFYPLLLRIPCALVTSLTRGGFHS
jgi:hypothetical protein